MSEDEDLALAATRDDSPGVRGDDIGQLGRLGLVKLLGSGGMGAVFEAFDPDLERRVAVKVLHARSADGRTRVLREARAMAKVSHPNVIAVFDVGTVNTSDFVVMELITGETLDAWARRAHPSWREIVAAFVQAGRGLAAAHAAAIVHRDFKPSNALRAHDGRIVVTDFGLSRDVIEHDSDNGVGLRGTPAYMAPEQWLGAPVSTATDQFAFCIALAELLAGAHPFGTAIDQVRVHALAGPSALDGVPRVVRAIVRRGLAVAPGARWPSMTEMLGALERALHRRRRFAIASVGAIVLAGLAIFISHTRAAGSDCLASAIDPDSIVTSGLAPEVGAVLQAELTTWRDQRRTACHAPIAIRAVQLSCLDGVIARVALAARLSAEHPLAGPAGVEGVGGILADPAMCARDQPPRLAGLVASPGEAGMQKGVVDSELEHALADYRLAIAGQPVATKYSPTSPCAAAVALRARVVARTSTAIDIPDLTAIDRDDMAAMEFGRRCVEDELARAIGEGARADEQPPQADLIAALDVARARRMGADQPALATSLYEDAARKYGERHRPHSQMHAILGALDILLAHGTDADLTRVDELVARWHSTGTTDDARALDDRAARVRWRRGDVAAADAALLSIGVVPSLEPPARPIGPDRTVTGTVVDGRGRPVADAEVASGATIDADSANGASPYTIEYGARTRTDAEGHFVLRHLRGPITAWTATANAPMLDGTEGVDNRLVLADTHRVRGRVDLAGIAATNVMVELYAVGAAWTGIAPVLPDGRFELDRVSRGSYRISAHPYGTSVGGGRANDRRARRCRRRACGRSPVSSVRGDRAFERLRRA